MSKNKYEKEAETTNSGDDLSLDDLLEMFDEIILVDEIIADIKRIKKGTKEHEN